MYDEFVLDAKVAVKCKIPDSLRPFGQTIKVLFSPISVKLSKCAMNSEPIYTLGSIFIVEKLQGKILEKCLHNYFKSSLIKRDKKDKEGNIIKVYANVKEFGNTSVTLYIEVRKHNVYTGNQEVVIHTNIKFVRIDEEGHPIPVSERVKNRYFERLTKYGKGLLDAEERKLENFNNVIAKSNN